MSREGMKAIELYFRDNFFNAGFGDIMDAQGQNVGTLNLKSAFGSSLEVYNGNGHRVFSGQFRFFSNKWEIIRNEGDVLGVLRMRMSFLSKRLEYDAGGRGLYEITAPAFSQEYTIQDGTGLTIASFAKRSDWLMPGAYCLWNDSGVLDSYELVTVVMGVNAILKRRSSG